MKLIYESSDLMCVKRNWLHYYKPLSTESYDEIIWGKVLQKAPFTFRAKINIGLETFYCWKKATKWREVDLFFWGRSSRIYASWPSTLFLVF